MSESMEFVIRARDEATKILEDFNASIDDLGDSLELTEKSSNSLQISLGGLAGIVATLSGAYAALKAGEQIFYYLNESANKFLELEMEKRLNDTLKQSARTIEIATNIDEGKVRSIMRSAQENFDPTQIEEVTKAAIGLSDALEISLEDALNRVTNATKGSFDSLQYLIPGIRDAASAEEKLAMVSAFASKGLEEKTDRANDGIDIFAKFAMEAENLSTTIGGLVAPLKLVALEGLAIVMRLLDAGLTPAVANFEQHFADMGKNIQKHAYAFAERAITAFTWLEVTITNFGTVWEVASAGLQLSLDEWGSWFKYYFGYAFPEWIVWFGKAFVSILQDTSVAASLIVENMGNNIGNSLAIMLDYMKGGFLVDSSKSVSEAVADALTEDLLRGFEPVTEALPELAERAATGYQEKLREIMAKGTEIITEDFHSKINDRMTAMFRDVEPVAIKTKLDLQLNDSFNLQDQQIKALSAFESRVMIRGDTIDDPAKQTANHAQHISRQIDKLVQHAENPRDEGQRREIEFIFPQ